MGTHRKKTTHCHVFDIHVSLSLQLSYYVSVEPLKLQVKRRRKDNREERIGRHTGYYKLDGWMEGYSLSSFAVSRKQGKMLQVSWRKMANDHLKCIGAGARTKSKVALMNESDTKRGNAYSLLSVALQLSPSH